MLEIKKTYILSLFCFKNRQLSVIWIFLLYIQFYGYCVSNAVDYAKKNDVLPTICQLN